MEKGNRLFSFMLLIVVAILSASCVTRAQEQNSNESSPFPLRSAIFAQELQGVSEDSETCSLSEEQSAIIEEVLRQFLQEEVLDYFTCDNTTLGTIENCPAANCSHIFGLSQIFHFPGYYWITAENGSSIQVYCDFESDQFPYAAAEIDTIEDESCPTMEERETVQEKFQSQLSQVSFSFLTCTFQTVGLTPHCPASNCIQVFDLIHEGFSRSSNYYWVQSPDGNVTEVYCNRSTMQPEYSSCQQMFEFETAPSGVYSLRLPDGTHSEVYCNSETGQGEYQSCAHANLFHHISGTYTIQPSSGSPAIVYCDMDNEECGGGVWMRVASYKYSDPSTTCPGNWNLITSPIRACNRNNPGGSCSSAFFSTHSVEFSSVCGRVIAIQYESSGAFFRYHLGTQTIIDTTYVDGVSITYGYPRQHVWTFASYPSDDYTTPDYLCPCSQPFQSVPSPPDFVGNNYFCDTAVSNCCPAGYEFDDPLWDGQGCSGSTTCCSLNTPPWFSTALPETTTENIEVRLCDDQSGDTPITILDLYIQ